MSTLKEIQQGDIILFRQPSGTASMTRIKNKGYYFTPFKTGMQLEGESIPIEMYEKFTYKDYKVLNGKSPRVVKLFIVRHKNGHMCQISENELMNNFSIEY